MMEADAEVPEAAITEAQWGAAQEAFEDGLPPTAGLADDKHALIVNVLSKWDELAPGERRTMGGGNDATHLSTPVIHQERNSLVSAA